MAEFIVGILTNRDIDKLKRCLNSCGSHEKFVVCNTLDKAYEAKARELVASYQLPFFSTESNGTPGKGKNSLLDIFYDTGCEYLIPIDGDDYYTEGAIDRIKELVSENKPTALLQTKIYMPNNKTLAESVAQLHSSKRKIIQKNVRGFVPKRLLCVSSSYKIRYQEDTIIYEDVMVNEKISGAFQTDEPLYMWDLTLNGCVGQFYSYDVEEMKNILEKTLDFIS